MRGDAPMRVAGAWLLAGLAAAGALAVGLLSAPAAAHQEHTTPLGAQGPVEAAVELSRLARSDSESAQTAEGADEVLLGRADVFTDTLAAGSATGRRVLLTPSEGLDERTADELERLDPQRVTLLGGTEALSADVADELAARGHAVDRLHGATRVQTALAIARRHHPDLDDTPVIVARAAGRGTRGFADALGGSALAHSLGAPVVVTPTGELHPDVADYLRDAGAEEVILAGGAAAISPRVGEQIEALGIAARRAGDLSRAGTAVAQNRLRGLDVAGQADSVLLLNGHHRDAWASGFAAGAWAAASNAAVVLATGDHLNSDTAAFLGGAAATDLVCGATVSSRACAAAERAMDLPPFATRSGVTLRQPSTTVEMIGWHEANHDGARQLQPHAGAPATTTLDSRGRPTGSRSAADIVAHPDRPVRAPVSGRVKRAGTYRLYCDHRDDYVVIDPDGHPGWEVKLLHIDGVRVQAGDRVVAGRTIVAPRPTRLPFASQVDRHSAARDWPHVHLEVIDPSIPNESSGGGC